MTTEIVKSQTMQMKPWTDKDLISQLGVTIEDIKNHYAPNATDAEFGIFLDQVKANQLDPRKKEVYFIKYGQNKAQIITGYNVYIARAQATGLLGGFKAHIADWGTKECRGVVEIHRKDWDIPFIWETYLDEVDKGQSTWNSQKRFQLKKCTIAQAFRICFPESLGGMPYTSDELKIFGDEETVAQADQAVHEPAKPIETSTKAKPKAKPAEKPAVEAEVVADKPATPAPAKPEKAPVAAPAGPPVPAGGGDMFAPDAEPEIPLMDEATKAKMMTVFAQFNITMEDIEKVTGVAQDKLNKLHHQYLGNCAKMLMANKTNGTKDYTADTFKASRMNQ